MPRMRATFSQRGDEICGTISVEGDQLFVLECLALQVENIAKKLGLPPTEVARDLYSLVAGKVAK